MSSRDALLSEESDNENFKLVEFYEEHRLQLDAVFLFHLPDELLLDVAVILHRTFCNIFHPEWKDYVNMLGADNLTCDKIEAQACLHHQLPFYVAMRGCLQHSKTLGHVIKVLLEKQRFDILHHIRQPLIEYLHNKKERNATENIYIVPSAPEFLATEEKESLPSINKIIGSVPESHVVTHGTFEETLCCDTTILCQNKSLSIKSECSHLHNLPKVLLENHKDEVISIFIPYATEDKDLAQKLRKVLEESNFVVRSQLDLEYLLLLNSKDALSALLRQVDFIVPVVSDSFLKQIHTRSSVFQDIHPSQIEDEDASNEINNRYIYQLLFSEYYQFNKCRNFRVRPVIVPQMNREKLRYELLLVGSMRLWTEVPKLVNVLQKTKKMLK